MVVIGIPGIELVIGIVITDIIDHTAFITATPKAIMVACIGIAGITAMVGTEAGSEAGRITVADIAMDIQVVATEGIVDQRRGRSENTQSGDHQ
jgi:hypothetical protein